LLSSTPDNKPTAQNLSAFLRQAAEDLNEGDNLFITYSGHGGILQDLNFDEDDFQDETWCLYDRQFLDDELFQHFKSFRSGVRIFIISDSCHSGTVARVVPGEEDIKLVTDPDGPFSKKDLVYRNAPLDKIFPVYMANKDIYEPLMRKPVIRQEEIKATVLLFGACQDKEKAAEWDGFGLFTSTIKKVLENNKDILTYDDFFDLIKHAMPAIQHPNLDAFGASDQLFRKQRPFQLSEAAANVYDRRQHRFRNRIRCLPIPGSGLCPPG
jgi:Caspase domain